MTATKMNRASSVAWVRVNDIRTSSNAQRELRAHMAEKIAAEFDPDKLGVPVLSHRDGRYWVVDGQHRIAGLKLMGYGDQLIECQVYDTLDERAEAELFLGLNTKLTMKPLDTFMVALTARRERELAIAAAVQSEGLTIGAGKNQIGAVAALGTVYDTAGADRLAAALRLIRDAFGTAGMKSELIRGAGLVTHRYNGQLNERRAVEKLSAMHGGMSGLLAKSEVIRRQVGRPKPHCIAAAIVETINSGRGGRKLPDWWS